MRIIAGLLQHILRVITFTHTGAGLPKTPGMGLALMVCAALAALHLKTAVLGLEQTPLAATIYFVVGGGILLSLCGVGALAISMLASAGCDTVIALAYLAGAESVKGNLSAITFAWELLALFVTYARMRRLELQTAQSTTGGKE